MVKIPTTDEMDSTTAEDRYKLVAMCKKCFEWLKFTGKPNTDLTSGLTCENCGGHDFDQRSLISQRTFNEDRAKKESTKLRNKAKK